MNPNHEGPIVCGGCGVVLVADASSGDFSFTTCPTREHVAFEREALAGNIAGTRENFDRLGELAEQDVPVCERSECYRDVALRLGWGN